MLFLYNGYKRRSIVELDRPPRCGAARRTETPARGDRGEDRGQSRHDLPHRTRRGPRQCGGARQALRRARHQPVGVVRPRSRHAHVETGRSAGLAGSRERLYPTRGRAGRDRVARQDRRSGFSGGCRGRLRAQPNRVIDQHIWVLEGEITIATDGSVHALAAGDCLHMHVGEGNSFRNLSGRPARYAVILTLERAA